MKIIQASKGAYKNNTVVTIGTFDGVHIGHQKIIQRLIKTGKQGNLETVVLTFFPHPRMVLQKENNLKLIDTLKEKEKLFYSFFVQGLYYLP